MTDPLPPPEERNIAYGRGKRAVARAIELAFAPLARLVPRARGEPEKILLVEPFMLGDAALLSVMLDPLRDRFPGAAIHLLVQPVAAPLYRDDPRVARVHETIVPWANKGPLPRARAWAGFLRAVRGLRHEGFDLGIDLRGDVRSQVLLVLAGCRDRLGSTNYLCSPIRIRGSLLTRSAGDLPLQHRTTTNLDLCRLAGCEAPRAWTPPDPSRHGLPLGRAGDRGPAQPAAPPGERAERLRLLVHTGGGWRFKLWPEDRWAGLLGRALAAGGAEITLVGAPGERERLGRLRARLPESVRVVETDVPRLVDEIDRADAVLCLDSGPMHLAALKGKPVLALFGPGVLTLYRPAGRGSRTVHHQDAYPCAPCSQRTCVRPDACCMEAIGVEEVWEQLAAVLSREGRP